VAVHSITAEADAPISEEQRRWDLFEGKLTTFQTVKGFLHIPRGGEQRKYDDAHPAYHLWLDHQERLTLDGGGIRHHWDGDRMWYSRGTLFAGRESMHAEMEPLIRDVFDELLTGFANSVMRFERPYPNGSGPYWYRVDLPFPWAQGVVLHTALSDEGDPYFLHVRMPGYEEKIRHRSDRGVLGGQLG